MVNDYVILGAGISGLVVAVELLKVGKKVTIIEGKTHVGGLASTIRHDDYVIDYGPHLFHSAHPEIIDYWRSFVGEKLVKRDFYSGNYQEGKIYDYPINMETALDQYSADELNIINSEILEIQSSDLSHAPNYFEYVRSLAGEFLSEKFFTNYPEKLWGINTKNLSARFAPRRIEIREKRLPFHSGPGRFAGVIEGGCGVLANSILDKIVELGGDVHLGTHINSVEFNDNYVISKILSHDDKIFNTANSCVVSTFPINKLSKLFGYETKLYFRNIVLVNIVINGLDPLPDTYDWLYFDQENIPFHRVGVQTRFSRENIKDGYHILCCEIAYDDGKEVNLEKLQSEAVEALATVGMLDEKSIINIHTIDIGAVYPGYYLGHELEVSRIQGLLGKHYNLYTTGSLADYAYSDLQVLTAKSIDLAKEIATLSESAVSELTKVSAVKEAKKSFSFGNNLITSDRQLKPYVIAEIGLCHNGSVEMCKKLIQTAKDTGFSSAKIQTYSEGRISKKSRTSRYFEETLDQEVSISDLLDNIIFTFEELQEIFNFAKEINFDLFSTPFDKASAKLLNELDVPGFKISSMDLTNIPLIKTVAKFKKPVILSTGMANIGEIENAINTLLEYGNGEIGVLHCVSSYPCPIEQSNLNRMKLIENTFNVVVGFSDHTIEYSTPAISISMGARIVEKHVTLDKGLDGPDHNFSLEPKEMLKMNQLISSVHAASNGPGFKASNIELASKSNLRRSIYANGELRRGDVITDENITIKSPGDGISIKHLDLILGKRIINDVENDMPLSWKDFINE